jgi:hypothetical protein
MSNRIVALAENAKIERKLLEIGMNGSAPSFFV